MLGVVFAQETLRLRMFWVFFQELLLHGACLIAMLISRDDKVDEWATASSPKRRTVSPCDLMLGGRHTKDKAHTRVPVSEHLGEAGPVDRGRLDYERLLNDLIGVLIAHAAHLCGLCYGHGSELAQLGHDRVTEGDDVLLMLQAH